jgi:hypothetical protein
VLPYSLLWAVLEPKSPSGDANHASPPMTSQHKTNSIIKSIWRCKTIVSLPPARPSLEGEPAAITPMWLNACGKLSMKQLVLSGQILDHPEAAREEGALIAGNYPANRCGSVPRTARNSHHKSSWKGERTVVQLHPGGA